MTLTGSELATVVDTLAEKSEFRLEPEQ